MVDTERVSPLRRLRLLLWIIVPVALAAGIILNLQSNDTNQGAAVKTVETGPGIGGPFVLTDTNGKRFGSANLTGKPFAIFFGFTRCPDVCPTTLARMARLRKQLGDSGDRFNIVFVSVDPGHDKPADIGNYLSLFGTPVIGLTGSDAELAAVKKQYGVYSAKVPQPGGDYTIDHTAAIFLMDAKGKLSATIAYEEGDKTALEKLKQIVG